MPEDPTCWLIGSGRNLSKAKKKAVARIPLANWQMVYRTECGLETARETRSHGYTYRFQYVGVWTWASNEMSIGF
jgi:hypothetical protein